MLLIQLLPSAINQSSSAAPETSQWLNRVSQYYWHPTSSSATLYTHDAKYDVLAAISIHQVARLHSTKMEKNYMDTHVSVEVNESFSYFWVWKSRKTVLALELHILLSSNCNGAKVGRSGKQHEQNTPNSATPIIWNQIDSRLFWSVLFSLLRGARACAPYEIRAQWDLQTI